MGGLPSFDQLPVSEGAPAHSSWGVWDDGHLLGCWNNIDAASTRRGVSCVRAGKVFNTWPQIDGGLIPSAERLFFEEPWWRNLFDNTLTVQFSHRMIAYALLVVAALHAIDAVRSKAGSAVVSGALWVLVAMIVQATLGVVTLLNQVPIDLGLAHQAMAIVVLTLTLFQAERLGARLPETTSAKLSLVVSNSR